MKCGEHNPSSLFQLLDQIMSQQMLLNEQDLTRTMIDVICIKVEIPIILAIESSRNLEPSFQNEPKIHLEPKCTINFRKKNKIML